MYIITCYQNSDNFLFQEFEGIAVACFTFGWAYTRDFCQT